MASEISGQLKTLKKLLKSSKKLNEEFGYFKKRYMRIHKGLSLQELKNMLSLEDIEFYYNSVYIKVNKNGIWFEIWKNKDKRKKHFRYLESSKELTSTPLYKKNSEFRKRVNYKLKGEKELIGSYLNAVKMIRDSKKIVVERKKRYKKIKKLIKIADGQGAEGKLLAIQNDLRLGNIIKLDMILTALRIQLEISLKEKIIRIDNYKKSETDRIEDRKKDLEALKKLFLKNEK